MPRGSRSVKTDAAGRLEASLLVALFLGGIVVFICLGVVGYVQHTLRGLRSELPVALIEQERATVDLGHDLDRLLLELHRVRAGGARLNRDRLFVTIRMAEERLSRMRLGEEFDDLVGAWAVHAVAKPVLIDVRNWLENGVHGFAPESPLVLELCDRRIRNAITEITPLVETSQNTALQLLREQEASLRRFRIGMIAIIVLFALLALLSTVLVIRALSDRRRVTAALEVARDAAERASLAKTQFLAGMSHELRTPLNAIIGFSALIRDQAHGPVGVPSYVEYGSDIHDSGAHLLSIVNHVLDMAKVEAGRYELECRPVDLRAVTRTTLRILTPRAMEGEVQLLDQTGDAVSIVNAVVNGDERAIRQILLNLISNAVKFTPPGGIVRVTMGRKRLNFLTLTVADTGIGIPEDRIETVLTPFEQIDNGLQRRYEGTGLGLPLARSLVELHGGALNIRSRLGAGTMVSVDFPLHAPVQASISRRPP